MIDILDLLRSDGSIVVNKKLAKEIGLNEAIIYSELVSLYKYWTDREGLTEEGFFFCTYENLEKNTTIKEKTASRTISKLEKLGLVEKKRMGLPAKTYYKITNGIYDLLKDIHEKNNKNGQNVRTDKTNVSDTNKHDNDRHNQNGQNVRTRVDNNAEQDNPKSLPNNTRVNNTRINNTNLEDFEEEEKIIYIAKENPSFKYLSEHLHENDIHKDTILETINECLKLDLEVFKIEDVENQFKHMMKKLDSGEVDSHKGFAKYFAKGLKNRTEQSKARINHLFNEKQAKKELEQQQEENKKRAEERSSIYYNWLEE